MVDIEGKELKLDDEVIASAGYHDQRVFKYKVIGFTPKGVKLSDGKYHKRLAFNTSTEVYKLEKNVDS